MDRSDFSRQNPVMETEGKPQSTLPAPAPVSPWAELWHVRFVIFPRRTITGRLARGKLLRRFDGRKWIYRRLERSN
jgi:hypothetical protein